MVRGGISSVKQFDMKPYAPPQRRRGHTHFHSFHPPFSPATISQSYRQCPVFRPFGRTVHLGHLRTPCLPICPCHQQEMAHSSQKNRDAQLYNALARYEYACSLPIGSPLLPVINGALASGMPLVPVAPVSGGWPTAPAPLLLPVLVILCASPTRLRLCWLLTTSSFAPPPIPPPIPPPPIPPPRSYPIFVVGAFGEP